MTSQRKKEKQLLTPFTHLRHHSEHFPSIKTFKKSHQYNILRYSTLFLSAALFNERGTMSLTTLLVFISLYTDTTSSLPSTAYHKHIDLWFIFSITYLSLIIITHLATSSTAAASHQPSSPSSASPSVSPSVSSKGNKARPPSTSTAWEEGVHQRHCWKPSDVVILKVARFVFSVAAVVFYFYYFA